MSTSLLLCKADITSTRPAVVVFGILSDNRGHGHPGRHQPDQCPPHRLVAAVARHRYAPSPLCIGPLLIVLHAVGAYFVYLPHCVAILVKKLRNGLSPWLPAACFFIFAATVLVSNAISDFASVPSSTRRRISWWLLSGHTRGMQSLAQSGRTPLPSTQTPRRRCPC